jgi:hypothetical protein
MRWVKLEETALLFEVGSLELAKPKIDLLGSMEKTMRK